MQNQKPSDRERFDAALERRAGVYTTLVRNLNPNGREIWRIVYALTQQLGGALCDTFAASQQTTQTIPSLPKTVAIATQPHRRNWLSATVAIVLPAGAAELAATLGLPAGWLVLFTAVGAALGWAGTALWVHGRAASTPVPGTACPAARQTETEVDLAPALAEAESGIGRLLRYAAERDADFALGYDITADAKFGEWVQKISLYVRKRDEQPLNNLYGELLSRLECMGIHVYDALEYDASGIPKLPPADAFLDLHQGVAYTQVTRAAVYSRRFTLVKGEIR